MTDPQFPTTRILFEALAALFQNAETPTKQLPELSFPQVPPGSLGRAIPMSLRTRRWQDALGDLNLEPNSSVLEFGCRATTRQTQVERHGYRWHGLTWNEGCRNEAREDPGSMTFSQGGTIPFADESQHAVLAVQTLNQTDDPALTFRELSRILQPGGFLIGSTSFLEPDHKERTFSYTPRAFASLVNSAELNLETISPGNDGVTSLIGHLVRGLGGSDEVGSWSVNPNESPLNYLIELCGLRQGVDPRRINVLKLNLAGRFHFVVRKPQS